MKLVSISESGLATGFYDVNNINAPKNSFEITNVVYDVWVNNTSTMKWDKNLEKLIKLNIEIPLRESIYIALIKIDDTAEQAIQKIMAVGYGQAMVYIEKFDEARDYVVDGYPEDLSSYPFIRNESKEFDESPRIIADMILTKKSAWIGKTSKIESARLIGKNNVRTAETVEGINLIVTITANRIKDII